MARHIDFDAVRKERQAEPITITLFGKVWTLPPSVPAQTVLLVARLLSDLQDDAGDIDISSLELTPGAVADIAESCVPSDVLRAWFAEGLELDDLGGILTMLLTEWNVAAAARSTLEDSLPEQPAPTGASSDPSASGSSTAGTSSRPTSPASTASI